MNIFDRLSTGKPIITDGAMGTLLHQRVPDYRGCFEMLDIEQPDVVADIHRLYIDAGADFILTNTFGANAIKLSEYGLESRCREINRCGAELARSAANDGVIIAGDISSTGKLVEPMGEATYDEIYKSYREQIIGLTEGGADILVIETMSDIQETKIALNAAKHNSNLPVLCSMTFESNGSTISGTDIVTALATLSAHGADIVGANCSLGPAQLFDLFEERIDALRKMNIPLSIWSNAGLPKLVNGVTVFPLGPEEFATHSRKFAEIGFSVIGGCCGTTPDHIRALAHSINGIKNKPLSKSKNYCFATSRYSSIDLSQKRDLLKIGERLNPSARKQFAAELRNGETAFLHEESRAQANEGADILDINVGVPDIDEITAMKSSIKIIANTVKTPLMIDSDNASVIEEALKLYPGCAIVNSINGKKKSIETVLPLIKKYGCFIIVLCLDESGVHRDADKRIAIGDSLIKLLESEGISRERIIIDPLMLAESAEPGAAAETLKVIAHFSKIGIKTSLGISNVSFGLPQRKFINNAFVKLAIDNGLTAGIINTKSLRLIDSYSEDETFARDYLLGKDEGAKKYIARFAHIKEAPAGKESKTESILDTVRKMVINGNIDNISRKVEEALKTHHPDEIMDKALIKGLEEVGTLYSKGEYFLPQMIASANAMKNGFLSLKPHLSHEASAHTGKVVICTVRGDIHDIGKNIVTMMLENHGFNVIDLGKDVPAETIIETAINEKADIIALSSLLTTTMTEMRTVRHLLKERNLPMKLIVGGAVVTKDYADSIGAFYGTDAVDAANIAKKIMD